MSITTKQGDKGKTRLYWGGKVDKDHVRIETNGMLDELSSFLGLLKSALLCGKIKALLERLQKDLMLIGSEIATQTRFVRKLKKKISAEEVKYLEEYITAFEKNLKPRLFTSAGENFISSGFDLARVLARKLERSVVTLTKKKAIKNPHILTYLNRLSDLLYLLSRKSSV
ncbi:MAG: cob(I)yrinic acid a,c-diamide adenosyltransferase [Candidatus Omnitrophica bacterium]|nr:cob(I)yrinic acid a,c-diamide adenosyltransferase [Candidatus Omnitrophota bacterium]